MMHRFVWRVRAASMLVAAFSMVLTGTSVSGSDPQDADVRDGVVLVRFEQTVAPRGPDTGVAEVDAVARAWGILDLRPAFRLDWSRNEALKTRFGFDRTFALEFPAGSPVRAIAAELAAVAGVAFAEPDVRGRGGQVPPDDTHYPDQWHLDNTGQIGGTPDADIDAPEGWTSTTGDPGVVVAVLDTGIDSAHPEFAGRIVPGFDFVNGDADPEADHPHGTQVAGIALANANNSFQVAGVDWNARLMPVKVLDQDNLGFTTDLVDGLIWATDNGADVINMSLINYPCAGSLANAVQYAAAAGVLPVASAGNNGAGDADVSGPGCIAESLSVGATDQNDRRASFSATGSALDAVAPGSAVRTVLYRNYNDGFTNFSGTSAAAPVVSGIAALLLATDPALTPDELRALIESNAEDRVGAAVEDAPGRDDFFGWGRVNARESLSAVFPAPLRRGRVVPEVLGIGATATFSVVYSSDAGNAPDFVRVVVSGPEPGTWTMTPSTDAHPVFRDGDFVNGEQFEAPVVLGTPGSYAFHFEAADAGSALRHPAAGEIDGPTVTQVLAEDVALSETSVESTVAFGTYTSTHLLDNGSEVIEEVSSRGGPPPSRYSTLDHRYGFSVVGGDAVTFFVSAGRLVFWPVEDDRYLFSYSTDNGTTWNPMLTVGDSAPGTYQTFAMPPGTAGPVTVRVEDTDSTPGNTGNDRVFIDHMFFRSEALPGGNSVHVASQSVVREAAGGPNRRAVDTVVIRNQSGAAVAGATVTATYDGPTSGTAQGVTDSAGVVSLVTEKTRTNLALEWCFTVTDVAAPGATYDPASNAVTTQCESGPQ